MLTLFPDLLAYSFFGPTVVRLTLGAVLLSLALSHFRSRERTRSEFQSFGALAAAFALGLPLVEALAGALIVAGLWTQVAAFAAIIISIKLWVFERKYPSVVTPGAFALLLMAAVALLLVITGPGAIAFDLPL